MNAKSPSHDAGDASAGAIPEMCTTATVVLLWAVLVILAVTAALLLLTLPGALDTVAGPTATAAALSAPPASTGR